jgi:hypothetical protein
MWNARDVITIALLHYKLLRMFGIIPIFGPTGTQVYCDNQGVMKNTSILESVLRKNHNALIYHAICETAAAGVLQVIKEDTQTNLKKDHLFTKVLPAERRRELLSCVVYNL